MQKETPTQ